MALAYNGGGVANSGASTVSSLALPAYTPTAGRDILIAVSLGSTASSVSSITSSSGTYGTPTLRASINGTGIRIEWWSIHVITSGASNVFTINITGGAAKMAATFNEWSGITSFGNTNTASGADSVMRASVTSQDGSNTVLMAAGFACLAGDVWATSAGTTQNSILPNATAVSSTLTYGQSVPSGVTFGAMVIMSPPRNWAAAAVELRSGSPAAGSLDYAATTAPSIQQDRDVRYLNIKETDFVQVPVTGQLFPKR